MLVITVLALAAALIGADVRMNAQNPEATRRPLPPVGPMTPTFH